MSQNLRPSLSSKVRLRRLLFQVQRSDAFKTVQEMFGSNRGSGLNFSKVDLMQIHQLSRDKNVTMSDKTQNEG